MLQVANHNTSLVSVNVACGTRLVVLLGESHIKPSSESQTEVSLLEQFDFFGLEGTQMKNENWVGRASLYLVHNMYAFFEKFPGLEESSIRKAQRSSLFFSGGRVERVFGETDGPAFEQKLLDIQDFGVSASDKISVALEDKHAPTRSETLANLYICAITCLFILSIVSHFLSLSLEATSALGWVTSVFNYYGVLGVLAVIWDRQTPSPRVLDLFVFPNGLSEGRNQTMAKNICRGFELFPERKVMVVVVGAAHVSGLKLLLARN